MTDTMQYMIAKAIWNHRADPYNQWSELDSSEKEQLMSEADAALKVLEHPTKAMTDAMWEELFNEKTMPIRLTHTPTRC